jgi:hypothetical protein
MNDPIFYHYIPTSNGFLCDRPELIEQDHSDPTGVAIKTLYRLERLTDESTPEDEEE